jgi:hypothetical protein
MAPKSQRSVTKRLGDNNYGGIVRKTFRAVLGQVSVGTTLATSLVLGFSNVSGLVTNEILFGTCLGASNLALVKQFRQFKINAVKVSWVPIVSSTTTGIAASSYDPEGRAGLPIGVQSVMCQQPGAISSVHLPKSYTFVPSQNENWLDTTPANGSVEEQSLNAGCLQWFFDAIPASTNLGVMLVECDVSLKALNY